MKKNMLGEQAKISATNTKMQATIAGIHMQENIDNDQAKKIKVGVCWEDCDFRTIGLDPKVLPPDEAPDIEVVRRKTHVFYSWIEDWEDEGMNAQGCPILEQQILTKYGGLKWVNHNHGKVFTVHLDNASFQKRGAHCYKLFGTLEGYDDDVGDEDQENQWEEWICNHTIKCIAA